MSDPENSTPELIDIRRCIRGFLVNPNPHGFFIRDGIASFDPGRSNYADLHAFDRVEDVATWLIAQYPNANPAPTVAPGLTRGPAALSDATSETDLRQGVTFIQHAVLDIFEEKTTNEWRGHMAAETCLHADLALPVLDRAFLHGHPPLPMACGLGTAIIGEPRDGLDIAAEFGVPRANDSDRDEHANWGWPLLEIEPWPTPIPMRGMQGLWTWPTPTDLIEGAAA